MEEIHRQERQDAEKSHPLIFSPVFVAFFFPLCLCACVCVFALIAPNLEFLFDRGECVSARSTPTALPIPVATSLRIPENLSNLALERITPTNAVNLGEVGQVKYTSAPVRELMFNPDNTLSLINDKTWLSTKWEDVEVDTQNKLIVYIESRPSASSAIWGCDTATNRQVFAFPSDETANKIRFSPDEKLFAINEGRGKISLYDAQTHARLTTFDVRDGQQWSITDQLAFSPDSTLLAFAMGDYHQNDYSIRVWDIKTSKQLASLQGHTREILGLAFNNEGTLIASTSLGGPVHLWGIVQQ